MRQLIADENFTSVQKAQAGLTKIFKKAAKDGKFIRVMRNSEPLGVLVPDRIWESFLEDLEALSSPNYLNRISQSRVDKKTYTLKEVKKQIGL